MFIHNLYIVTKTHNTDSTTEVLAVYDANFITLDEILDYYEQQSRHTQCYYGTDCGFVDILDANDMLKSVIKVTKKNALIKNK